MKKTLLLLTSSILLFSCNKTEGPGGTSTISGTVTQQNHESSRTEITEVICTPGLELEHGDYWVLNNPPGATQYYIYYDNPEWISPADPELSGRTGISVSFNYSDSNIEIAENTMQAIIEEASGSFDIALNTDILIIQHLIAGETPDADRITTPFEVNIDRQGRASDLGPTEPAIDEKVYLVYGNQTNYGEMERTGGDGEYLFTSLTNGSYTVYCLSKDTTTEPSSTVKIIQEIEITEKKSVTEVETLHILN